MKNGQYDVPGTKRREFELKKMARKLTENTNAQFPGHATYKKKLVNKMLKLTTEQIDAIAKARPSMGEEIS